jgi:cytochrome c-type biogenesis protein CcmH/NrfG
MSTPGTTARVIALAVLLGTISPGVASAAGPLPTANPAAAASLNAGFERCRARADIDACYDALRRNPTDPALLGALGDALVRVNRPADALRTYRRVATLAPGDRGIIAKINALEAKLSAKPAPVRAANEKRYSNVAPESQSH